MVHATCHRNLATILWGGSLLVFLLTSPLAGAEDDLTQSPPDDKPQDIGDPWNSSGPPQPLVPACFDSDFGDSDGLTEVVARRWLAAADGQSFELSQSDNNYGCAVTLKGAARLRAPWMPNSVLRLSLYSSKTFELQLWAGTEGIDLHAYPGGHRQLWAAYRTSRPPSGRMVIDGESLRAADPALALLATDGRRGGRTVSGTFEIRHQHGSLVMTQGDVRLLTVPLAARPTEVYLKGDDLLLRHIAMFPGEAVPDELRRARATVIHGDRPADLRWHSNPPDTAELKPHRDGLVTLSSRSVEQLAWANVPLLHAGLYEIICRVEDPSPGTGIYLGHDDAQPGHAVGFFRDPRTGSTLLAYDRPGDAAPSVTVDRTNAPVAYVGRRQWLRLVLSGDTLKCWVSGDGTHWGQALPPLRDVPGGCSHVGIYCRPGPNRRSIAVRRLFVRRLDALTSLAPIELRERAEQVLPVLLSDPAADFAAWRNRVWEHQPASADPAAWRRACAVASLSGGCPSSLGNRLLDGLLDNAINLPPPSLSPGGGEGGRRPDEGATASLSQHANPLTPTLSPGGGEGAEMRPHQRHKTDGTKESARVAAQSAEQHGHTYGDLLEDAALLYDTWSAADADRFAQHVERWGRTLLENGDVTGFHQARRKLMELPLWTESHAIEPLPVELAGHELVALACREQWPAARLLCRQLEFFNLPANLARNRLAGQTQLVRWVQWADGLASRRLTRNAASPTSAMPADWRHPLILSVDKEAYNVHAELLAALREQDYQSACQNLIAGTIGHDWGMIVDPEDEQLVTSLSTACMLLMREHPPLSTSMRRELDGADLTRLRRALAQADVPAVRAATLRYYGTRAAAEASGWLGDRLFAEGRFARAISCYERALSSASPAQRQQLAARLRLAAAMLGKDAGEPVMESVTFGKLELVAGEFEALVAEMRETHAGEANVGTTSASVAPPPSASARQPRPWAKWIGAAATDLSSLAPHARPSDWAARQVATTLSDDLLLASDRTQIVAYDLATGNARWSHATAKSSAEAPAYDALWSMVPMRPQVAAGRVAVRLLGDGGWPRFVCLDRHTGRLLWTGDEAAWAVSDPVWTKDELLAVTSTRSSNAVMSRFVLTCFSPDSGAVLSETPLIECRGLSAPLQSVQLTLVDDNIVGAGMGTVFCCDTLGQLRWVRRETWIPPSLDPQFPKQQHEPPLIDDDRVYVTQPGTRNVLCSELGSGRRIWRLPMLDARRLIGVRNGLLLVETETGIRALHADTGRPVWDHPVARLLDCYPRIGPAELLYARSDAVAAGRFCPTLAWLDPASGNVIGTCGLMEWMGDEPLFGPVFAAEDRLWCFRGTLDEQGKIKPEQDIVELVAAGPPTPAATKTPRPWPSTVSEELSAASDMVLPGWAVLSAPHDQSTGLHAEMAGKRPVLVTKADATPVRMARQMRIPAGGNPRLVLEIGHAPDTQSKLLIRAAGIPVLQVFPQPTTNPNEWQRLEADLTPWAGREVWITMVQQQAGDAPAYMYWRRVEIIR